MAVLMDAADFDDRGEEGRSGVVQESQKEEEKKEKKKSAEKRKRRTEGHTSVAQKQNGRKKKTSERREGLGHSYQDLPSALSCGGIDLRSWFDDEYTVLNGRLRSAGLNKMNRDDDGGGDGAHILLRNAGKRVPIAPLWLWRVYIDA